MSKQQESQYFLSVKTYSFPLLTPPRKWPDDIGKFNQNLLNE